MNKILFILHSNYKYNKGGAELQAKYISEYLVSQGFSVSYLFLHKVDINFKESGINFYGIKKKPFLDKIFGKICYYQKVLNKLNELKPDIIYHRNLSAFALPVIKYCKNQESLSILHLASKTDVEKQLKNRGNLIKNVLDFYGKKQILLKFNKIIAQAKYQDDLLKSNYNRLSSLILYNVHPFPNVEIEKPEKIKIVWVANYKSLKQPDVFIKLAKACKSFNVEFIMIGRDYKNILSTMVNQQKGKLKNLIYLGELPIERVNEIINESEVFVNTSLYEGFPNTFIQSWMRGVPVVSLHVDPDDILVNNKIGFHSKTLEGLINDVRFLIQNKIIRNQMGERAKKFSFINHSNKNLDAFISLLKEK